MQKYHDLIKNIVNASKNGKLVFFVGAGLSRISKYPKWDELVNRFYEELYGKPKDGGIYGNEYLQIPQMFYDVKTKDPYNAILKEVFDVEKEPNNVHYKMLALNPIHILTTNYDDLIEKASLDRGRHFSRISCDTNVSTTSSKRYLLKVHGDFSNGFKAKNIVLKERDYMEYEENFPLVSNLMKSIMATHTIVFIGYGLGDYNINLLINWVKRLQEKEDATSFFIRGDYDPIEENVLKYYEKKGIQNH